MPTAPSRSARPQSAFAYRRSPEKGYFTAPLNPLVTKFEKIVPKIQRLIDVAQQSFEKEKVQDWNRSRLKLLQANNLSEPSATPSSPHNPNSKSPESGPSSRCPIPNSLPPLLRGQGAHDAAAARPSPEHVASPTPIRRLKYTASTRPRSAPALRHPGGAGLTSVTPGSVGGGGGGGGKGDLPRPTSGTPGGSNHGASNANGQTMHPRTLSFSEHDVPVDATVDVDVLLYPAGFAVSDLPTHMNSISLDRDSRLSPATLAHRLSSTSKLSRPARDEKAKDLVSAVSSLLSNVKSPPTSIGVQNASDSLTDALFLAHGSTTCASLKALAHALRAGCSRKAGRHEWAVADLTSSLSISLAGTSAASQALRKKLESDEGGGEGYEPAADSSNVAERFAMRGSSLAALGWFEEAVKDFSASILLHPRHWGYRYNRSVLLCDHVSPPKLLEAEHDLVKAVLLVRAELEIASPHRTSPTKKPINSLSPSSSTHANPNSQTQPPHPSTTPLHDLSSSLGGDLTRVLCRLLLYRGSVRMKLGATSDIDGASRDFQEALGFDATNPTAWILLSEVRFLAEDFEGAEKAASSAIDIDWDHADFFRVRGKARLALHSLKGETPSDPAPNFWSAVDGCLADLDLAIAILEGKIERAKDEEIHERAMLGLDTHNYVSQVEVDTDLVPCWILRSRAYLILNQQAKALADSKAALAVNPSDVEALHQAACVYISSGELSTAIDVLEDAIMLDPAHKQSLFALANCHIKDGNTLRAGDYLGKCIGLGLSTPMTHAALAGVRFQEGLFADSANCCDRAIELGGKGDDVYFQRAEAKRCLHDYTGALDDYNTVLCAGGDVSKIGVSLHFGRGVCLAEVGNVHDALQALSAAAELDPLNTNVITFRGKLYAKLGMHDEAEDAFERGLTIAKRKAGQDSFQGSGGHGHDDHHDHKNASSLWPLLNGLAHAMYEQKKFSSAGSHFSRALQWAVTSEDRLTQAALYYKLGVCLANTKRFGRSAGSFTEALRLSDERAKDRALYLHERGKCFQMMKNHVEAITDFSATIKLCPKDDRAIFRRAWSYKALGLYDSAAEDFHKAKILNPTENTYELNFADIGDIETIVLRPSGEERTADYWDGI